MAMANSKQQGSERADHYIKQYNNDDFTSQCTDEGQGRGRNRDEGRKGSRGKRQVK